MRLSNPHLFSLKPLDTKPRLGRRYAPINVNPVWGGGGGGRAGKGQGFDA